MKIHRVEIQNLNSLYGVHTVDFDVDVGGAPLFLIIGPTGSGKSTILDAISLALFGETPRLTDARGQVEFDSRATMSRGAGGCLASVVFSKQSAHEPRRWFRATWECWRARRKADGRLQVPRRTLEELDAAGECRDRLVSDTREKFWGPPFAEVLDEMGPDEFQRSMMLAQGQFAAFLRADEEERATILERLTNTERYREIGARAAERHRQAKDELAALQSDAEALRAPTDVELAEARAELGPAGKAAAAAEAAVAIARARLEWLRKVVAARTDHDTARVAREQTGARVDERAADRARLTEAERCAPAAGLAERVAERDAALVAGRASLAEAEAAVVSVTEAGEEVARAAERARAAAAAADNARAAAAEGIRLGRAAEAAIDHLRPAAVKVTESRRTLVEREAAVAALDVEDEALAGRRNEVAESAERAAEALREVERQWTEALAGAGTASARSKVLDRDAGKFAARRRDLDTVGELLAEAEADVATAGQLDETVTEARAQLVTLGTEEAEAAEALAALRENLAASRSHRAVLTAALALHEERSRLQPDEPCPLCGSAAHPYLDGEHGFDEPREVANATRLDEEILADQERIDALEGARRERAARVGVVETRSKAAEEKREQLGKGAKQRERRLDASREQLELPDLEVTSLEAARADCERAAEKVAAEQEALDQAETALETARKTRAEVTAAEKEIEVALTKQRERRTAATTERDRARKAVDDARALVEERAVLARNAVDEVARTSVEADESEADRPGTSSGGEPALDALPAVENAADALIELLHAIFGGATPEAFGEGLQARAEQANVALRAAEVRAAEHARELQAATSTRAERQRSITAVGEELDTLRAALKQALADLGLPGPEALADRVLSAATRATLRQELDALDLEHERSRGREEQARATLDALEGVPPEGLDAKTADPVALEASVAVAADMARSATETLVAVRARIEAMESARDQLAEMADRVDMAQREHDLWLEMKSLIGTNEGAAFKRYAQTLNLQDLVDKANIRLRELAPRYTLVVRTDADDNPELGFAVMDHEHADQIRPQTTLSGGETFLVSLALALALSDYRATEMPIETLLLDEGFGTLDTETLDVAMSALEHLCASGGTQIGVISHVEGLKERIDARIVIEKLGGGRSRIVGP